MKKITDEELVEIQTLKENLFGILTIIGELHLSKRALQRQLDDILKELTEHEIRFDQFQESERVLFEKLQQTYGTGSINIETGEVTE